MAAQNGSNGPIALWQGFRHRWQYNHRANRIGSYVRHKARTQDASEVEIVHTAASGTGPDRADFTDLFVRLKARGVAFQPGHFDIRLETVEEELANFNVPLEVTLDEELRGREVYTVLLNGFDLYAEEDADKLMTLALEAGDPQPGGDGRAIRFDLKGAFRVDCSSPECDRVVARRRRVAGDDWTKSIFMLDWQLQTAPRPTDTDAPRSAGGQALVRQIVEDFGQSVNYTLRVHYVIVAGNHDALRVTHSRLIEHDYEWNRRHEIHAREFGKRPLLGEELVLGDSSRPYAASVMGFKQFLVSIYRDIGKGGLHLWRFDKAMHVLEWNMAISDIREIEPGSFTCTLDMFVKNWAKGMKNAHFWQSLFAYKDGGRANFGASVTLLQFADAEFAEASNRSDSITWPGGDRSAKADPAAISVHPVRMS